MNIRRGHRLVGRNARVHASRFHDNLGIPKKPTRPFYHLPPRYDPTGKAHVDLGLADALEDDSQSGKVKVPTLRFYDARTWETGRRRRHPRP
jgi:cytochrome c peroxidase